MADGTIEDALKITLADYRLSRGEKRALTKVVEKIAHDEQRLAQARRHAFKIAREELVGPDALDLVDWLEDVMKVLMPKDDPPKDVSRSEAFFSPHDNCASKIVRLFETARKSADVCVFTITDDRIKEAMLAAHRRKIAIRIISDDDKSYDLGSDIKQLGREGVPVRVDQSEYHMHNKYALFDDRRLLTGSYNWTRSASRNNAENFIVTGDTHLVTAYSRSFVKLWDQLG